MKAALYCRVSTEEQAMHGLSIDAQREALTQYAHDNDIFIADYYIDAGVSGRKPVSKRPELLRLLDDARAGKFDTVLFTKLDRWFRNVGEYYKVQSVLEECNISWKTIHEDYDTSTASGRLKVNIMLSVAQDEADRTSERIKTVFASKLQKGEVISGNLPMGYMIVDKKIELSPDAENIRRILLEYPRVQNINAVADFAKALGYNKHHHSWRNAIRNECYTGKFYGIEGFAPAIITPEEYRLNNEIMDRHAQRNSHVKKNTYIFSRLVYCAECGKSMNWHKDAHSGFAFASCRMRGQKLCTHSRILRESVLEQYMIANVLNAVGEYNTQIRAKKKTPQPALDKAKLKRRLEKLKDLYLDDLIDKEAYEAEYTAIKAALETQPEAVPEAIDIAALRTLLSSYHHLTISGKKEFWTRIVSRIDYANDGSISITLRTP